MELIVNFRIINFFTFVLLSFNLGFAVEIKEWQWMIFSAPTQNFAFQIKTANIYPKTAFSKDGDSWDGKINPVYIPSTGFDGAGEWYSNNCTIETYEFALKITDKSKSVIIKSEDKSDPVRVIDSKSTAKYTFCVYNFVDKSMLNPMKDI